MKAAIRARVLFVCPCQHALQDSDAQLRSALTSAQTELDRVVTEVKSGKLSHEEAEECIQLVSESMPSVSAAAAAVKRAKSRGHEGMWDSVEAQRGVKDWAPSVDEPVRLIKLGGKVGKVTSLLCSVVNVTHHV